MPPWFLHPSSILPGTTKEQIKEKAMPADWSPAKRRQKDLEATWTKKHGESSHGFKLSVCVDHKHKLIRKWVTHTTSVHDSQHFDAVLDDWNASAEIYADRGYPSQEREEQLKAQGYRGVSNAKAAVTIRSPNASNGETTTSPKCGRE